MSIAEKVATRLSRMRKGQPFVIEGFYTLGSRTSVQKAMSRLAQQGVVVRVSKGIYVRPNPIKNIPSIKLTTSPEQVARKWARKNGYKLVPQGQQSAYRLGFQTQAPVKTIFWTNGPSREFRIGNSVVVVKHVAESKLRLPTSPEGELLRGMSVTNANAVSISTLKKAFERLGVYSSEASKVVSKMRSYVLPAGWESKLTDLELAVR